MNRQIDWDSYYLDDIELVYEKGLANDHAGELLEQLEEKALAEAKENCALVRPESGHTITPDQFDSAEDYDKEFIIMALGTLGVVSIHTEMELATIFVELAPPIQDVMACTIFSILNRLEKLDGAANVIKPTEWTLKLQVPLGGKKGLFQWELLIMELYPWLSVSEIASNKMAETLEEVRERVATESTKPVSENQSQPSAVQPSNDSKDEEPKRVPFWKRLFGKK